MSKKVFIQIPAYNEEMSIADVLKELPRSIPGFDVVIEILVINDGSTDKTVDVVKHHERGVHILNFAANQGLGVAFRAGLEFALSHGADVIINTDGDNQYSSEQIKDIAAPILSGRADVVIGNRRLLRVAKYPKHKLISQTLGNLFISMLFLFRVRDATSGFRAFSKEAAALLVSQLENKYTYTIESLCVLLKKKMQVVFVPISISYPTRTSRLIKSKIVYVKNFVTTALKIKVEKQYGRHS